MWGKIAQLFFRRPDLLLNHVEAYTEQIGAEITSTKARLGRSLAGLLVSAFLLALAVALLAFAAMLDLALGNIAQRFWLYALPAVLLCAAAALCWHFARQLQAPQPESELQRQARADFALLRSLAEKKTEGGQA